VSAHGTMSIPAPKTEVQIPRQQFASPSLQPDHPLLTRPAGDTQTGAVNATPFSRLAQGLKAFLASAPLAACGDEEVVQAAPYAFLGIGAIVSALILYSFKDPIVEQWNVWRTTPERLPVLIARGKWEAIRFVLRHKTLLSNFSGKRPEFERMRPEVAALQDVLMRQPSESLPAFVLREIVASNGNDDLSVEAFRRLVLREEWDEVHAVLGGNSLWYRKNLDNCVRVLLEREGAQKNSVPSKAFILAVDRYCSSETQSPIIEIMRKRIQDEAPNSMEHLPDVLSRLTGSTPPAHALELLRRAQSVSPDKPAAQ